MPEFKRDDVRNHGRQELVAFLNLKGDAALPGVEDDGDIAGTACGFGPLPQGCA